ncbi:tripartite tricarboxylate transporter TctB family protein, partial [Pseudothermotoga sp.]|uniref:tripartite tricarboxylate transporter TctB family protein n=1 Tax=Pseudothermotoga sp. TaxID=2033661 RepID=UPI0031F62E17
MNEFIASLCFLISGIVCLLESQKIRVLRFGSMAGDFFPKLLSLLMVVISAIWLLVTIIKLVMRRKLSRLEFAPGGVLRTLIYLAGFASYIVTVDLFGFLIPSVAISMLTYLLLKEKIEWTDILKSGLYSTVMVWVIWLLFTKV